MQRFATVPMIVVLALFAVYTAYVAIRSALTAEGYNAEVFWPSIALMLLIAAAAAWVSFRLYRLRASKPPGPLTNG